MWKVWAWSEGVHNFGDELGPLILQRMGLEVQRVDNVADATILTVGSMLEHAAAHARPGTFVWGSGLMHPDPVDVSHLNILAVRGKITARTLGCDVPTADPGALVPYLWPKPSPRWDVGVMRHYMDTRPYYWADHVIDATGDVDETIEQIGSCRRLASSSLHGLIIASSWNIPSMRLHHPQVAGGNMKWADWFSARDDPKRLVDLLEGARLPQV